MPNPNPNPNPYPNPNPTLTLAVGEPARLQALPRRLLFASAPNAPRLRRHARLGLQLIGKLGKTGKDFSANAAPHISVPRTNSARKTSSS